MERGIGVGPSSSSRLLRNLCVVDDVRVCVWELILYLFPRMFGLFVKGDVDRFDVTSCVENMFVGVSVSICDESESFVLDCL